MAEQDDLNRIAAREDRDYFSYTRDADGKIAKRAHISNADDLTDGGLLHGIVFDEVQITYPTSKTEVFTYKEATVTVATITATYLTAAKKDISSVIRT